MDAYFARVSEHRFRPSEHTRGAWSEDEQHISPMTGLLAHEMERHCAGDGLQLARITLDIHGVIGVGDFEVEVSVLRPGRTITLVGATVTQRGRVAAQARAWRLAPGATGSVAGGEAEALPGPDDVPAWDMRTVWPGGYISSLEVRRAADAVPGRAVAWVRTDVAVLAGEDVSPVARWLALVDTANGLSVRQSPREWLFPNVDLTVHLHRHPTGEWVGFDTRVVFGAEGLGMTEARLHDTGGPVGRAAQSLTVRPGPGASSGSRS